VLTATSLQQPFTLTGFVAAVLCKTELFNVDGCAITPFGIRKVNCLKLIVEKYEKNAEVTQQ
jgi:hypothetical protein